MTLDRVRYREGQYLTAADLVDEQAYRLALGRRHHISHHDWGIVTGLALAPGTDGLLVQPGMAVDGYGRELLVPEPLLFPMADLEDFFAAGETLAVWLLYGLKAVTPPQRGRWDCRPGRHSRWREEPRLCLTRHTPEEIDSQRPWGVPEEVLVFSSHWVPPDDPEKRWPVYLGWITRAPGSQPPFTVNPERRPYAGLVGEVVNNPADRARMQVGSELAGDSRRFAVSIRDAGGGLQDRLAIDAQGNTAIWGNVTIKQRAVTMPNAPLVPGDLVIGGMEAPLQTAEPEAAGPCGPGTPGPAPATRGINFQPLAAVPAQAAPWQIYQVAIQPQNRPQVNQLRLEIGHPGKEGDPTQYQLAIGTTDDQNQVFTSCLTVTSDCQVILSGDLYVDGQITQGPIQPDPDDPRFAGALLEEWLKGQAAGASALEDSYAGELQVEIDAADTESGNLFSYSITVSNTGRGPVTDILAIVNITAWAAVSSEIVIQHLSLDQGQSLPPIEKTYDPGNFTGALRIAVAAAGLGAGFIPVYASGTKTVQITQPPPGPN